MSCTEVMYQPYAPYFPYPQRPSASGQTITSRKLVDSSPPPTNSSKEDSPKASVSAIRSTGERASSSSSTVGSQSAAGSLRDSAADAQYISANCVVFTYFSGDTSSVVDEHFSRALSQQNYNSSDKSSKDNMLPMAHRSFPPSFWNINHAPAHHHSTHTSNSGLCIAPPGTSSANAAQVHELYASAAADAYHHSGALHPTLHHQNDPWHYSLSASAAGNPYSAHHHHHHHRAAAATAAIHDLSYSSASNRFNAQYSSLLLQPASMRSTRLTPVSATCTGFEKSTPDMSWPTTARYHHEATMNFAGHPSMDPSNYSASAAYGAAMTAAMSGLENQVQDTSKDLYWF